MEPAGNADQGPPQELTARRSIVSDTESTSIPAPEKAKVAQNEDGREEASPSNPAPAEDNCAGEQRGEEPSVLGGFVAGQQAPVIPIPPFQAPPPPPMEGHPALAMAHYYEARMRDHAAAYASAAAHAAWAAAQVAVAAAEYAAGNPPPGWAPPGWNPAIQGMQQPPMPAYVPIPVVGESHPPPHYDANEVGPAYMKEAPSDGSNSASWSHRRKRQHRLRPDVPRFVQHPPAPPAPAQQPSRGKIRRRLRSDGDSSSSGSSWVRHSGLSKKPRSDASLLGKTGVAALYEWCSKRHMAPTFVLEQSPGDFDCIVYLDNVEYGRGRGRNKVAARQEAARRALLALAPGMVFDELTGLLKEVPSPSGQQHEITDPTSMEDLAPNLAKQLAIGHRDTTEGDSKKRSKSSTQQAKRTLQVYPGTSTTSEEEDENAYYTSRGASVCSALLHAMVQIDSRIPEPPIYTYEVEPLAPTGKRKVSNEKSVVRVTRGSFTCTARLKSFQALKETESEGERDRSEGDCDRSEGERDRSEGERDRRENSNENSGDMEQHEPTILEAVGLGGTKREARHVASAKLLAQLFPDCSTMVEVKEAAEAARERYAAEKAAKQQQAASLGQRVQDRRPHKVAKLTTKQESITIRLASKKDPRIPSSLDRQLVSLLERESEPCEKDDTFRQVSRKDQVDKMVERALNDCDEDRFDELTADDVGRTILRRAAQEDIPAITKLFVSKDEVLDQLNSPSSIVLILCRAISAFEDPPLGCAVLTFGFSMEEGRLLRVADIATETHLPEERFRECLEKFATAMKYKLQVDVCPATQFRLTRDDMVAVLRSHVVHAPASVTGMASPLQSVQEEEEGDSDSSAGEKRMSKRASKPSKRTRVE